MANFVVALECEEDYNSKWFDVYLSHQVLYGWRETNGTVGYSRMIAIQMAELKSFTMWACAFTNNNT